MKKEFKILIEFDLDKDWKTEPNTEIIEASIEEACNEYLGLSAKVTAKEKEDDQ